MSASVSNSALLIVPPGWSDWPTSLCALSALGLPATVVFLIQDDRGNWNLPGDQRAAILAAAGKARGKLAVVLAGYDPSQPAPQDLLDLLSATTISGFFLLQTEPPALLPHRPFRNCLAETLLVFPGAIVPVTMGSHRRAFQLCRNLAQHGYPVDVLIAASSSNRQKARPLLEQVASRVIGYNVSRLPLKGRPFWRRKAEDLQRRLAGLRPAPMTFSENLLTKAKFSGRKTLRRLVYSGRYKNIIVSYAWLDNIRDLVPPSLARQIRWLCDTHDVQFIRNNTDGTLPSRLWVEPTAEKRRELELLNSYDHVIAISDGDAETLRAVLEPEKVIAAPNGFDYMKLEPCAPDPVRPVFGFIGRSMEANELALSEILTNWWPAISNRWPEATLRIAGGICSSGALAKHPEFAPTIVLDRHVEDLPSWYRGIDVLINPVVVRGGLNYKSVEALVAGRLVLTNSKGAECFAEKSALAVAEDGSTAVTLLQEMWSDPERYLGFLKSSQTKALERFGDDSAIRDLLSNLKTPRLTKQRQSRPHKAMRVLIQAGDHHENRQRLLPLARAIRERGHHPVVMVYSRENVPGLLAAGVDAIALYDYNEGRSEKEGRIASTRRIKTLNSRYREFDLDDIADSAQMATPEKFAGTHLHDRLNDITLHIDRILRVVDHVTPDCLVVWNGYTGYCANVLRCLGYQRHLPMFFAERSILSDGVFLDPRGVNGYSELASIGAGALQNEYRAPARTPSSFLKSFPQQHLDTLRSSGPWAAARRIIFVPLQVQKDTNITMHSPDLKSMADLVRLVHGQHAGPDTAIVVRPHPEEVDFIEIPDLPGVHVETGGDLDAWLEIADLVVTVNSTVGLTALLRGRPVMTLGDGIYTGVGLTDGRPRSPEERNKLWAILANNYTSFPESPLPHCLEQILPEAVDSETAAPVNPFLLDPLHANLHTEKWLHETRASVLAQGVLSLSHDLTSAETLNLTYRRTSQPWDNTWLEKGGRAVLGIPGDLPVDICDTSRSALHVYANPSVAGRPGLDRYFWPVPATCSHTK